MWTLTQSDACCSCLFRSSPTPKAPWVWAAPSLRVVWASSAACHPATYPCTSTTPRSPTLDATSVRLSSPTTLTSPPSSTWTWRVQHAHPRESDEASPRLTEPFCPQFLLLLLAVLCRGSQRWRETWPWAAHPAMEPRCPPTAGRGLLPRLRSSSHPASVRTPSPSHQRTSSRQKWRTKGCKKYLYGNKTQRH